MSIPNSAFKELVTTTFAHHKNKVTDNVANHNAFLRYMKEHGNIKTDVSGGHEIRIPLAYAENDTYNRFYGGDVQNIEDSDVLTTAQFDWKQVALHVTATGREIKLNAGKEKIIGLVKARTKVAMETAANNMSVDIYSDGSASNQVGGLQHLVQADGTGTVGSINSSTYSFWQNKFKELAGTSFANVKTGMNELWLSTCRGMNKTDLIILTHDLYTIYEGGLQDLQRYGDSKAASLGFEALKYKTASVIFDDNSNYGTTDERGYFLNTKELYLQQHPDAAWTEDDEKVPINQDKVVVPIYWMGNLCCDARRDQGVLVNLV